MTLSLVSHPPGDLGDRELHHCVLTLFSKETAGSAPARLAVPGRSFIYFEKRSPGKLFIIQFNP